MAIRLCTRRSFRWNYDDFIKLALAVRLASGVVVISVDRSRYIGYQGLYEKRVGVTNTVIRWLINNAVMLAIMRLGIGVTVRRFERM